GSGPGGPPISSTFLGFSGGAGLAGSGFLSASSLGFSGSVMDPMMPPGVLNRHRLRPSFSHELYENRPPAGGPDRLLPGGRLPARWPVRPDDRARGGAGHEPLRLLEQRQH